MSEAITIAPADAASAPGDRFILAVEVERAQNQSLPPTGKDRPPKRAEGGGNPIAWTERPVPERSYPRGRAPTETGPWAPAPEGRRERVNAAPPVGWATGAGPGGPRS